MPFLGDVYSFLPPLWSRLVFKWETSIAGDECFHSCHSSCWWSTGWNSEWWLLAKNSQGAIKGLYSAEGFCTDVIIYPVEVYCSAWSSQSFSTSKKRAEITSSEKIVLKATRKMAKSLKLKRSNYLESMKIEPWERHIQSWGRKSHVKDEHELAFYWQPQVLRTLSPHARDDPGALQSLRKHGFSTKFWVNFGLIVGKGHWFDRFHIEKSFLHFLWSEKLGSKSGSLVDSSKGVRNFSSGEVCTGSEGEWPLSHHCIFL